MTQLVLIDTKSDFPEYRAYSGHKGKATIIKGVKFNVPMVAEQIEEFRLSPKAFVAKIIDDAKEAEEKLGKTLTIEQLEAMYRKGDD
jgi:hypothetical protein